MPDTTRRARLSALTNTLIVAGGYLLSRVLGLLREVIISNQFGTLPELDSFRATFAIVDLIYIVIAGGALGTTFIPVFAGMLGQQRRDDAWRLASAILNLALVGLIVTCVLVGLLADPIVAMTVGSGFAPAARALTVDLLRLMLIQPLLLGVGGLAKAVLEAHDRFGVPAFGANLYNIGIIIGALLSPWLGVYGLVVGVDLGALAFLLIQIPALRGLGVAYVRRAWADVAGVAQVLAMLGPRLFGQAVWQINLIAVASFASLLGAGAVAANGYALQLMMLPHGLLALSVGTVIFPQLARLHADGDHTALQQQAVQALRGVLFVALPASALLAGLATPVVRLLFERGAFDSASTALTSSALIFYMLGLAAFTASEIVVRTFYAMQDTRTPVAVGCVAVLVNLALGLLLVRSGYGLPGLAYAFSVANLIEMVLLLVALFQRIGDPGRDFWGSLAYMSLSALVALVAVLVIRNQSASWLPTVSAAYPYQWPVAFPALALWTAATGAIGAALYAALAWALRIPELRHMVARVRRR